MPGCDEEALERDAIAAEPFVSLALAVHVRAHQRFVILVAADAPQVFVQALLRILHAARLLQRRPGEGERPPGEDRGAARLAFLLDQHHLRACVSGLERAAVAREASADDEKVDRAHAASAVRAATRPKIDALPRDEPVM